MEPTTDDSTGVSPTPRSAPTRSMRTWLGAGIGAAAIAAAAVVGVHALGTGSTANAASRGAGAPNATGMPGPGGAPGGYGQGMQQRPPGVVGQITSVSGDTIVVQDPFTAAAVTVHTTSSTTVKGTATSVSALQVGDRIRAEGTRASDGSVTATEIHVGDGPPAGAGAPGDRGPRGDHDTDGPRSTT